jgi:anti-sigma-K factor RskA
MFTEAENHVSELLPDYVLDVLTDEETNHVAEHLAVCQACQDEYRGLQLAADELPLALAQTAPPQALKARIMGEIHARNPRTTHISQPSIWQQLGAFLRQSAPAWSLAIIAVLAFGNWISWSRLNQASNQLNNPMRVIALASTNDSPQAMGTLIMDQQGYYGTLVVDKLAQLDNGHQYQVWLNRNGERISAGLFSIRDDGYASLELQAPMPLSQYDTIGITVEPAGGSPGPTGAKILEGDIPN